MKNTINHGIPSGYSHWGCRCVACSGAHSKYQCEFKASRRRKYMADKSCGKCGTEERLHLHHIDPATKLAHTSTIWGWAEKRRLVEIAKCEILCSSCHARHHHPIQPSKHGTVRCYRQRNCHCGLCRGVMALKRRMYLYTGHSPINSTTDYIFNLSQHFVRSSFG